MSSKEDCTYAEGEWERGTNVSEKLMNLGQGRGEGNGPAGQGELLETVARCQTIVDSFLIKIRDSIRERKYQRIADSSAPFFQNRRGSRTFW